MTLIWCVGIRTGLSTHRLRGLLIHGGECWGFRTVTRDDLFPHVG